MIKSGRWIWVYDNLNLQQSIRHEREGIIYINNSNIAIAYIIIIHCIVITDCHSAMMNVTSRLAVSIRYLPEFDFDWSNNTPQRSRDPITIKDISPSESDAAVFKEHAIQYLMDFLVKTFSSLCDLEEFIQVVTSIHPVKKSDVVPMKLLLKDEKYKSETIGILTQLYEDTNLSGDHQVCNQLPLPVPRHLPNTTTTYCTKHVNKIVVGDQLTCKVIRGSKLWRSPEPDPKNKLIWANEIPGMLYLE